MLVGGIETLAFRYGRGEARWYLRAAVGSFQRTAFPVVTGLVVGSRESLDHFVNGTSQVRLHLFLSDKTTWAGSVPRMCFGQPALPDSLLRANHDTLRGS
jgi:hypothetical protein